MGFDCDIPDNAEVISSIGDALSFVRVERERSVIEPTLADSEALAAAVEEACLAAGAALSSIDVRVEHDREHATLRASATGMIGLSSGAMPGRSPMTVVEAVAVAGHHGFTDPIGVGHAWISRRSAANKGSAVLLLDRYGDVVTRGEGDYLAGSDMQQSALVDLIARHTRRNLGSEGKPEVWLVHASRIVSLTPAAAIEALNEVINVEPDSATAVVVAGK
jgi:hypothetical protein